MTQTVVPNRAARHAARQPLGRRAPRSLAVPQLRRGRFSWRLVLWVALPFAAIAIGAGMGFLYAFANVPTPLQSRGSETIFIYDNKKQLLGTLVPEENREWVALKDIPPIMKQAVLAAEDHDFYEHGAISYRALGRAFLANLRGGGVSQGGSTLSQQYIKVTSDQRDKTYLRKAQEAMLAVKLEQKYSKDQIFEFYLNTIYFGRGASGVKAAAKAYFNPKRLADIKPEQAAFLAGIIRNPQFYSKPENWDEAQARRDRVLRIMGQEGYLTPAQVAKAQAAKHGVDEDWEGLKAGAANSKAPYFVEKVKLFLEEELGKDNVARGGLKVYTTLDQRMQKAAEEVITKQYLKNGKTDPKAALVAIDARTGAVKALYGGRRFETNQYNYAVDARRPLGSTIKPFLVAEWLEQGYSIDSNLTGRRCWEDESSLCNYGRQDFGELMPLREAIKRSANTPFVEMLETVGREEVIDRLQRAGVGAKLSKNDQDPFLPKELSLALGTAEASTLQLTSAFGTFANNGVHVEPYIVSKVTTLDNKVERWSREKRTSTVMSPNTANTVSALLSDALEAGGTGFRANLGRPAAGKTGTTDNNRDARFAGYIPNGLVASVWLGYDNNKGKAKSLVDLYGFDTVDGGTLPAKIWKDFMTVALRGQPAEEFGTWEVEGEVVNPTTTAPPTTVPPSTDQRFPFPGRGGGRGPGGGGPGGPDQTFPSFPPVTEPPDDLSDGLGDDALSP